MTAQRGERLIYKGEQRFMFANPLEDYFLINEKRPNFLVESTDLWRGYMGTWEVRDNKLFLNKLEGLLEDQSEISIKTVFPNQSESVFASWVTNKLRVPDGERLKYVHLAYASMFERDLILEIKNGYLISTEVIVNEMPKIIKKSFKDKILGLFFRN